MAAALREIAQLVVQVAGRFARQARVITVGTGATLLAMAGGAGSGALGHVVGKAGRGLCARGARAQRECGPHDAFKKPAGGLAQAGVCGLALGGWRPGRCEILTA